MHQNLLSRQEQNAPKITEEAEETIIITAEELYKARNPFLESFNATIAKLYHDSPMRFVIVEDQPAAEEAPTDGIILAGPPVSAEEMESADEISSADGILPADENLPADGNLPADEILPADGSIPADGIFPAGEILPADGTVPAGADNEDGKDKKEDEKDEDDEKDDDEAPQVIAGKPPASPPPLNS